MVVPVKIGGEWWVELLVGNGLLNEHLTNNRYAIDEAYLAALEQWAVGLGWGA